MKLGKVTSNEAVERVAFTFKKGTVEDLKKYQAYYQATYGEPITAGHMAEEILKAFMSGDKDFQKFVAKVAAPAAAPAAGPAAQ
ncbi:DUF2274 domain-containing protein [Ramlibacter alkalitolerans]|uniref:DUF2274 domain-containing protein n=1 Tax=Ramlibacter alkalitolerans TaxID=2039631 RepID=A0ABS1JTV4_9BURK|nr:DUF2274 domain-containing protein [Ramlibacter alkalitolerans]MBL0427729.1 DUF2274 domain-containing protein [Ramlibacter alkalitolerans]